MKNSVLCCTAWSFGRCRAASLLLATYSLSMALSTAAMESAPAPSVPSDLPCCFWPELCLFSLLRLDGETEKACHILAARKNASPRKASKRRIDVRPSYEGFRPALSCYALQAPLKIVQTHLLDPYCLHGGKEERRREG